MQKNIVRLSVGELKPGMITAEEINEGEILLASKRIVITNEIINKLNEKFYLNKIAVYSEEIISENIKIVDIQKTVEDIEESFADFSDNIKETFNNMYKDSISDLEEIKKFTQKINEELCSTRAVIKNIVLHGSGEDAIYRHSVNVAALSTLLGRWIGLSDKELNLLTYSAILHDFGKTKIDENILNKLAPLTPKEFQVIKTHSTIGYNLMKQTLNIDEAVSYGVLMHHERMDGSGYPLGIKGDKIHTFAKIIAIADTFDAVNSNRIYKKKKGPFEALEIINKESFGILDYEYCNIFIDHVINYYMGERVVLNTKKIYNIAQVNKNDLSRPLLFDDLGFVDLKKEKSLIVEEIAL